MNMAISSIKWKFLLEVLYEFLPLEDLDFRLFFCEILKQSLEFSGALPARPPVVGVPDVPLAPLEPVAEGGRAVAREELLPPALVRIQGGGSWRVGWCASNLKLFRTT